MSATHPEVVREEDVRIAESRRRVEGRLAALRAALRSDFGLAPRTASWVLPAIGLAVGFGLAVRALQRRRSLDG